METIKIFVMVSIEFLHFSSAGHFFNFKYTSHSNVPFIQALKSRRCVKHIEQTYSYPDLLSTKPTVKPPR